ncbi:MAG: response regulator transcription factor [Rhizomicrobium sp.]
MSENNKAAAIAVIHSNALFRAGLASLLTGNSAYKVTDTSSMETLEGLVRNGGSFDAVLVELAGIKSHLIEHVSTLRSYLPNARVALLSGHFDPSELALAFSADADGVILESVGGDILLESLKLILLGEKLFPSPLARYLSSNSNHSGVKFNGQALTTDLSDRELEILRCLIDGDSNKRIANRLNITEATVKVHLKSILRKTHVLNRTQAAIWALQRGVGLTAAVAFFICAYDWISLQPTTLAALDYLDLLRGAGSVS